MTVPLIASLLAGWWLATFAGTVRWALMNREGMDNDEA